MKLGVHLPHLGRKAGPDSIRRAAVQAEELGFADIWVSEHLAVPKGAPYPPSPLFYEPIVTMTWAAAFTSRVRIGTSVLVLPMRHPVPLAKELATLQCLSQGRIVIGAGIGWLEAEYAALGVPFRERGRRMDEGIALMRAIWSEDPVTFETKWVDAKIENMRMQPHPSRPIPIWIGGMSEPALKRAEAIGDGWHGSRLKPAEADPIVQRLRASRPEGFTISLRNGWDGQDEGELRGRIQAFAGAGLDHLMIEPWDREAEDWMRSVERIARAGEDFLEA